MADEENIVGLIPAAGAARRLGGTVRGSKEILPLGGRPVCAHLIGAMRQAGATRIVWVVRREKQDIERSLGPEFEYVRIDHSASVPETVSHGLRAIGDHPIALGFPDVIAEPQSALRAMVERFNGGRADVVLGLFPTDRPDKADLVRLDRDGAVLDILHKPGPIDGLSLTWLLAVWNQRFSARLLRFVETEEGPVEREPQLSDVVKAALADGLGVATVAFPEGSHLDIGTPEDLERARAASLARISQ